MAPSLVVDLYELSMVDAYRRAGMAHRPATFSLFVRELPEQRNVLVAAGLDACLTWLEQLRFGPAELEALRRIDVFSDDYLDWLAGVRFTGDVRAVPEGTPVFAGEPVLEVDAPVAEAQLAETYLLNQITLQTNLATNAARFRHAASGRAVVDFALRRAPGIDAGMSLVRAACIVGLDATSNVAGAARYGLPATGTMAHAFVQAHLDEADAFRSFAHVFRDDAVLLVDTFDTVAGIDRAIEVMRETSHRGFTPRGIRIDSGDLDALTRYARARLDEAGLDGAAIYVSGGLDEHRIAALVASGAPIDGFGVGTALAASSGSPSLDTVYKLVRYAGRDVRKTSPGKATWPGAKQVWRPLSFDDDADVLALADEPAPIAGGEPLLHTVMSRGRRTEAGRRSLDEVHQHFTACWDRLADRYKALDGPADTPVRPSERLLAATERLDAGAGAGGAGGARAGVAVGADGGRAGQAPSTAPW